jgi:hypothetical protein
MALFPLEILNHIFDSLDHDESTRRTLKACSTIRDPILRAAIDRYMYTHIHLCEWNLGSNGYEEIHDYLTRNPHVANYIHTLDIMIVNRDKTSSQFYNAVSSILQMLPSSLENITLSSTLHIDGTGSTSRTVPAAWPDFPETFRKAFLDCLWSPSITEASMKHIGGFPLSIFNPCTRLKKLSLRQVECTPSLSDAQFPPQIDSLVLSRNEDLTTILSWMKDTGHDLRSLTFKLDFEADQRTGYGQLTGLLDSYSNSLIDLAVDFRPLSRFYL